MITVYSTPGCALCNTLKVLYNVNKMEYEEKTIGVDITKEDLEHLANTQIRQAPVVFNDGEYLGGFMEGKNLIHLKEQEAHAASHAQLADELKILGIDLL